MISDARARVNQLSPSVFTAGDQEKLTLSQIGQIWTADWHQRLIAAGKAYTLDLGTIGATDWTALTGNAAVDDDQPEVLIAIDSGYLIPMEIEIDVVVDDFDAYDNITQITFIADRSQGEGAGATGTVEVANNLLDGGELFAGRCYSIVTSDVSAVVMNDYLGGKYWTNIQLGTEVGAAVPAEKSFKKVFRFPTILKGPCQIAGYVIGTNTPTFMGAVKFAHVPATWFPTPS